MADPTTTKGGKFRVLLGSGSPLVYEAKCGFTSKSLTMSKNLEEVTLPDCDDPDEVPWVGRDATSLSMSVSGEGVAAEESIEDWLDAAENPDSVPVKIELEFPSKLITRTGRMHIASFTAGHPTTLGRVTANVDMQSDGEMARVVTP